MIREATIDDLQAITTLESLCFPKEEAATASSLKQRIETFPHSFLIFQQDNEIIAMINGCVTNQTTISDDLYEDSNQHIETGDYQAIFGLDVHPMYQHQGFAHQMMQALISLAKQQGRKGLILTCKEHLISFYESFGYQNLGISDSVHGGAIWYDMRLDLK